MNRRTRTTSKRRGGTMMITVLCAIGLFGLLALAIEVGSIAVARSQAQNAADSAAMAGARTINGNSADNYNLGTAPNNAVKAATSNYLWGSKVTGSSTSVANSSTDMYKSGNVSILLGTYGYNYNDSSPSAEGFSVVMPRSTTSTEPYSAVRATVTGTANLNFARIFGISSQGVTATAVAVHRPRDVFIIMDLSGSMRFQSLAGIPLNGTTANPSTGSYPRTVSMNNESIYPQWGAYSATSAAALRGTSTYSTGSEQVDLANISASSNSGSAICEDFYANASGATPSSSNRAFSRTDDSKATTPGGYNCLKTSGNTTSTYAVTVNDIVSQTSYHTNWETNGYSQYVTDTTSWYTEGPGYWGKTFFTWPPDPRGPASSTNDPTNTAHHANNGAKDWRQRFFFKYNTSTSALGWMDHNSLLFNDTGSAAPATYSSPTPTPIIRYPGQTRTITENGVSITYTYRINYLAILNWLKNETPTHFPSQIRAGRICYYSAWPDVTDTTLNNRWWTTGTLTNVNERLWRDYINFVLGVDTNGTSGGLVQYVNTQNSVPLSGMIGCGDYYKWGSTALQITQKPDGAKASSSYQTGQSNSAYSSGYSGAISVKSMSSAPTVGDFVVIGSSTYRVKSLSGTSTVTLSTGLTASLSSSTNMTFYHNADKRYMDYLDNPYRPKHQFWFGAMTFVDWLGNYQTNNLLWPGNVHEAQAWACKVGIQTAIDDIKNNHPNDFLGMTFFSAPMNSRTDSGHHNRAVVTLGRNYQQLKDSLWFPPSTVTGTASEITPYDTDMDQVPRANGGTAPQMGFMICYNQLSSSVNKLRTFATPTSTYRGNAGGLGRKGATRIVVFETDRAPNTEATASLQGSDSDAYYKIRVQVPGTLSSTSNTEWPTDSGSYSGTTVYNVVKQIVALDTASPPGFSQTRHTATVYPIAYGSLFDPNNTSTAQTNALTFMQNVAYYGKTASDQTGSNFPDKYRIYGTNDQRVTRMQTAFTNIMQSGTQVTLIE